MKIIGIVALLASMHSMAGTAISDLKSTARLNSTCNITTNNVEFGTLTLSPAANNGATITNRFVVLCSKTTAFNFQLSKGTGASQFQRSMGSTTTSDRLYYNLYSSMYSDSNTPIYGDGNNNTYSPVLQATGNNQNITVFAYLRLNQYITPGLYKDDVVATLIY